MGAKIDTDIEGIIRELNLSESDVLFPFFEAVVNSIQSVHEKYASDSQEKGNISIYIERDRDDLVLFEKECNFPIKSIRIVDNGIGFDEGNFKSFLRSHSTKKHKLGGKGLGRFTMLSLFDSLKIQSSYKTNSPNPEFKLKSFELSRSEGINDDKIEPSNRTDTSTEITLSGINSKFKQATARYTQENIADSILEHCLLYYLKKSAPTIIIIEDGAEINLSNQFNPSDFVKHTVTGDILGHDFTCYYVKSNTIKAHRYLLCAHDRTVKSKRIDKIFPIFTSKVGDNEDEFWLQVYVVSEYLNDIVNMSRNEIVFPKMRDDIENDGIKAEFDTEHRTVVVEKDIDKFVIDGLQEKYQDIIEARREYMRNIVDNYLNSDEGLEYRTLDIDNDFLSMIPDTADNKRLDDVLHEHQYRSRKETRKKRERLLKKDFSRKKDYQSLLADVVSLTTKEGNSQLAQYVAHRKTIIDLFEKYLSWCEESNNKYTEESTLHNLIFAMGGTHEDTPYDSHNLWLLDDRLSFHRHIYSDKAINTHATRKRKTESKKETDLAIYDVVHGYGEKTEYNEVASAVIFEFKRPGRTVTYEDFSKQFGDQVEGVIEGKVLDKNGLRIATSERTPVFFYYVCDINAYNSIKSKAIINGFRETPYKSLMRLGDNVYTEIMTYQALLINSRRRNKAFFKKLGIE